MIMQAAIKHTIEDLPSHGLVGLVKTILDLEKIIPDFPRQMIVDTYVDLWFGVEVPTHA